jgi:hypothetical protein
MNRRECVLLGLLVLYTICSGAALLWLIGT